MKRIGSFFAVLAAAAVGLTSTAPAAGALPPPPTPTKPMPTAVDVPMPYEATTTCDLTTKPGVSEFAELMARTYNRQDYHTTRACLSDDSQHYDGRAVDWMLDASDPADREIADAVAIWLTKNSQGEYGVNARRFGIMLVIWNHEVWKSYRDIDRWTPYTGSVPHTDHIHVSFAWDGACKRTSWFTGTAVTTLSMNGCGTGPLVTADTEFTDVKDVVLALGSGGETVRLAQSNLPGVGVDGDYGTETASGVRDFQRKWGLDVTGRVNRGVWNQMERVQYPLIKYRTTTVLRRGMSGLQAIKDAQRALRVTQTGTFGPITEAAVKRVQGKYRLAQTGVIRELTWAALDEELRSRARVDAAAEEILAIRSELAKTG